MTPSCVPSTVEAIKQCLETHRPFPCALSLGREGTVKVFEDHQRGGVLSSFLEQTENIGALLSCVTDRRHRAGYEDAPLSTLRVALLPLPGGPQNRFAAFRDEGEAYFRGGHFCSDLGKPRE